MKHFLLCIVAFAFLSCSDGKHAEVATTTASPAKASGNKKDTTATRSSLEEELLEKKGLMRLETFTSIPEEFIGCGCSFFLSKEDKKARNYIYRDAGDIAMLNLNGVIHSFDYKGKRKNKTLYANDSMLIEVDITKTVTSEEMEETSEVEGTFSLTKGKEKLEQKFVGYCGC
ncbi:hypothetical protein [Nibribacter koreensis]|uniref:NlpE N-terminal domain-containing protein n=1 Tax=Nibribacter koreensis TaxID=1084519 RepID=A0ABP8FJZ8_9BACT